MASDTVDLITNAFYNYIFPSICLFGILCNTLNLTVLSSKRLRESPFTYLTALACADLLTFCFTLSTFFSRGNFINYSSINIKYFVKKTEILFFMPTVNVFSAMSVSVVVALTIERFLFMKFPLHASTICTKHYARRVVAILFVFIALFRLPMYFFRDVQIQKTNQNVSMYDANCSQTIMIVNKFEKYHKLYFTISLTIFEIIPFFVLSILNVGIVVLLKQSNKGFDALIARKNDQFTNSSCKRMEQLETLDLDYKQFERRKNDEIKLTRQLALLITLFFFSEIWSIITYETITHYMIGRHFLNYMNTEYKLQVAIADSVNLIMHSSNFLVLCAFNTRYFNIFKEKYSFLFNIVIYKRQNIF